MADKPEKKEEMPEEKSRAQPAEQHKEDKDAVLEAARRAAFRAIAEKMPPSLRSLDKLTLREVLTRMPTAGEIGLPSTLKLQEEISKLRLQVQQQTRLLTEEKTSAQEKERHIETLEKTLNELRAKEQLGFLLDRVNPNAQRALLESHTFRQKFLDSKGCTAFVMSVDIRRSTELMLKARTPEDFASFITTLCADLMRIISESYGVFDKFTGDGVLLFFPEFYSGRDAAYLAVSAADKCHEAFNEHYHAFRKSFTSILIDIGLGIGIDYGSVHLVQMAGGLTVVGAPVVYACRLSGGPAGKTFVNQPAYEIISDRFGAYCFVDETIIDIKHEGRMLAYEARLNGRGYALTRPGWFTDVGQPAGQAS